jgi:hypothetical protein
VFVNLECGRTWVVLRDRDFMNSVEDLDVFKLAHELALKTYSMTKAFPRQELFGLGERLVGPPLSATHFGVSRILETWKFPFVVYLSLNF